MHHVTKCAKMDYLGQKYFFLINLHDNVHDCALYYLSACIKLVCSMCYFSLQVLVYEDLLLLGNPLHRYEHTVSIYKSTSMYFLVEGIR